MLEADLIYFGQDWVFQPQLSNYSVVTHPMALFLNSKTKISNFKKNLILNQQAQIQKQTDLWSKKSILSFSCPQKVYVKRIKALQKLKILASIGHELYV